MFWFLSMLKHSAWLLIFCLARKDLELLLFLSANIDWHIIIHVQSQSPEKFMIFSFILTFSRSSFPLPDLCSFLPPCTVKKKLGKIQVYEVLCFPILSFVIIFYISNYQTDLCSKECFFLCNKYLLRINKHYY